MALQNIWDKRKLYTERGIGLQRTNVLFLLTFKCFCHSGGQKAVWPKRRPFCPIPVHPSLPAAAAGRSHVSYQIFILCPNDDGRLCSCERARWWNVPRRLYKKKKKKSTVTSSPPCHADRRYTQNVGGAWASAWADGNQTPAEAPSSCQASGVRFITRIRHYCDGNRSNNWVMLMKKALWRLEIMRNLLLGVCLGFLWVFLSRQK